VADETTHSHEHEHEHDHAHDHDHDHGDHDHDHAPDAETQKEFEEAQVEALKRRALQQIRQYPDVALRMKAHDVTEFDEELVALVERMQLLMNDAQGVGLAATQAGIIRRLFVFVPGREEGLTPIAVVNPVLELGAETDTDDEGCLSMQGVTVPVERATAVTLTGKDENGEDVRLELEGLAARIVQHETDHLDGTLVIDRTDDASRKEALRVLRPRPILVA
jgi:peptide deformylase